MKLRAVPIWRRINKLQHNKQQASVFKQVKENSFKKMVHFSIFAKFDERPALKRTLTPGVALNEMNVAENRDFFLNKWENLDKDIQQQQQVQLNKSAAASSSSSSEKEMKEARIQDSFERFKKPPEVNLSSSTFNIENVRALYKNDNHNGIFGGGNHSSNDTPRPPVFETRRHNSSAFNATMLQCKIKPPKPCFLNLSTIDDRVANFSQIAHQDDINNNNNNNIDNHQQSLNNNKKNHEKVDLFSCGRDNSIVFRALTPRPKFEKISSSVTLAIPSNYKEKAPIKRTLTPMSLSEL